jgi:hypothetical protein
MIFVNIVHSLSVKTLSLKKSGSPLTTNDKNIIMPLMSFGGHPLVIVMSVRRVALHMSDDDTNFFSANYLKYLDVIWMDV